MNITSHTFLQVALLVIGVFIITTARETKIIQPTYLLD